jgi:cobalt-zinc-cadmium efflux system outer membrane protein
VKTREFCFCTGLTVLLGLTVGLEDGHTADKPFWKSTSIRIGKPAPPARRSPTPETAPKRAAERLEASPSESSPSTDEAEPTGVQLTSQSQVEAALPPPKLPPPAADGFPHDEVLDSLPGNSVTLDVLTAFAVAHHPRLTTAFQQVQAARGRAHQAGLYPNPIVSGSSPQMAGSDSQYNGFVTQDFITAGKLKLDVAAICREVQQAEHAWQQSRFAILTDLRMQFFSTLAAQNRVAVLESLVKIASRSRDVSQKLLDAGEGTRGDTLLFDIEVDRAEVALANADTVLTIGKRQLAMLIAVPDMEITQLDGDFHAPLPEYDVDQLRFQVASVNAQANIARIEIDRQATLLRRAEVQPIPNVNVMGGYQRQIDNPAQDQGLFQVSVAVPLWNKNQGAIFAAQSQLAGARADVQRVELELGNQAADALASYRAAGQLVDRYEQQMLPKARETLKISQQLYAQGQIDFLRLLAAQKTLLESELARISALEQRWLAAAAIAGLLQQDTFP